MRHFDLPCNLVYLPANPEEEKNFGNLIQILIRHIFLTEGGWSDRPLAADGSSVGFRV